MKSDEMMEQLRVSGARVYVRWVDPQSLRYWKSLFRHRRGYCGFRLRSSGGGEGEYDEADAVGSVCLAGGGQDGQPAVTTVTRQFANSEVPLGA